MNKQDREKIGTLAVTWSWIQGGSQSEASAYGRAAHDLLYAFGMTNEDIGFDHAYKVAELNGVQDNNELIFAMADLFEADYSKTVDMIEVHGFSGFIQIVEGMI